MKTKVCSRCGDSATGDEEIEKKFGLRHDGGRWYRPQSQCKPCRRRKVSSRPPMLGLCGEDDVIYKLQRKRISVDLETTRRQWKAEYPNDNQSRTWKRMVMRLVAHKGYAWTPAALEKLDS